ncbi:MAG: terminase large subunit domain-containing protein, partial [Solirubrobacteraceae bacterium]
MTAAATTAFPAGYHGFTAFCAAVGYQLKPFQKRIARAHFGAERECVAVLPRGSAKSTLGAHLAAHHCLSRPDPGVYIGAASRDQARIIGAMVRALSRHPAVSPHLVWRTDALRWADDPKGPAVLSIVASSGDKAHGWPHPTLIVADEVWSWSDREPTLLGAMMTAMFKNPGCRFFGISTSASTLDSPLGTLRRRALASPKVERKGPVLEASGAGLHWMEWSLGEDADPENLRAVGAANPLRTVADMREQRRRVSDLEWLQFHCCIWGVQSARWLPADAWSACRAVYDVDPTEPLILGVDIGGSRSATAVVGCLARPDGGVDVATVEIWQGAEA